MSNIHELVEQWRPSDAAVIAFFSQFEPIHDAEKMNRERAAKFQSPVPVPSWEVGKMIEIVKILAGEHACEGWGGKDEWESIALISLRDKLCHHASDTKDDDLMRQLIKQWPEITPPRDLTPEELKKLWELQAEADTIIARIRGTVKDGLAELSALAAQEAKITEPTSSCRDNRIDRTAKWTGGIWLRRYVYTWTAMHFNAVAMDSDRLRRIESELDERRPQGWSS